MADAEDLWWRISPHWIGEDKWQSSGFLEAVRLKDKKEVKTWIPRHPTKDVLNTPGGAKTTQGPQMDCQTKSVQSLGGK